MSPIGIRNQAKEKLVLRIAMGLTMGLAMGVCAQVGVAQEPGTDERELVARQVMMQRENPERMEYRMPVSAGDSAQPPLRVRPNGAAGPSYGKFPAVVRHAYGFDKVTNQGAGQTIAVVDAYDDAHAEADLAVFSKQFGLAACTTANGCFSKVYATGQKPAANAGWAMEIALDVEWAHAIAPQARIVLVEAASNNLGDLYHGVDVAVRNGASVVSMSWGCPEYSGERGDDAHFASTGVTFTASSGDNGSGVPFPAASPDVVAIGGTTLAADANGNYWGETAWSGSGGGQSAIEVEPVYQAGFSLPNDAKGRRGVPDVAFDADPSTGFAIYDSAAFQGWVGWFEVGGTSAGTPQWAGLFAIANSSRVAARKRLLSATPGILYGLAKANYGAYFHDETSGSNGKCGALCTAGTKYDYVTGLGSPRADALVAALVAQP
jgi:subtilase family serine protease